MRDENGERRTENGERKFKIQRTKNKEQIQRDSFDGVFDRLNHRLGMTPTIKQSTINLS